MFACFPYNDIQYSVSFFTFVTFGTVPPGQEELLHHCHCPETAPSLVGILDPERKKDMHRILTLLSYSSPYSALKFNVKKLYCSPQDLLLVEVIIYIESV